MRLHRRLTPCAGPLSLIRVRWNYEVGLLENLLFSICVAMCANPMRWFAFAHIKLQGINERFSVYSFQPVALFLSIPCFHISNFFFKVTYALQQRKLVRLGRECARLGGQDLSL